MQHHLKAIYARQCVHVIKFVNFSEHFIITFHFYSFRVAQAYVNQKKLDTETKILQANATQFAKQTMQWLKLVEDFNQSLKVSSCVQI